MKFVKQNRIIHVQLQEGKLLARGRIDPTSVRWIPIDEFKIYDKGTREDVDYHTLTWDRREIDFDYFEADADHVVV